MAVPGVDPWAPLQGPFPQRQLPSPIDGWEAFSFSAFEVSPSQVFPRFLWVCAPTPGQPTTPRPYLTAREGSAPHSLSPFARFMSDSCEPGCGPEDSGSPCGFLSDRSPFGQTCSAPEQLKGGEFGVASSRGFIASFTTFGVFLTAPDPGVRGDSQLAFSFFF